MRAARDTHRARLFPWQARDGRDRKRRGCGAGGPKATLGDNKAMYTLVTQEGATPRTRYYERATLLIKRAMLMLLLAPFLVGAWVRRVRRRTTGQRAAAGEGGDEGVDAVGEQGAVRRRGAPLAGTADSSPVETPSGSPTTSCGRV